MAQKNLGRPKIFTEKMNVRFSISIPFKIRTSIIDFGIRNDLSTSEIVRQAIFKFLESEEGNAYDKYH
ncbi:MAG: hypothetical protein CVU42_12615 [Chloroflexi bacterium HGW-Chloroflexi-4]|jgi:hypothetical protein|nr:MAG: hypothetical protein CVU42_12615 [Chloroflexi bacterium HGW-Chloroflexi-4]